MQPKLNDQNEPAFELKASNGNWAMTKKSPDESFLLDNEYYIVWISEQKPSFLVVDAAKKISNLKNLFLGFFVQCKLEPELGFVLKPLKGWKLETQKEAQQALDDIVWEINRLSRS